MYSVGTDIGGTFTDCVVTDGAGAVTIGKAPSTPPNFARGFFDAIQDAATKLSLTLDELLGEARVLVHATTAATNAVVERTGAPVGLITTAGHGEAILIMRGGGRSKGLDVDELLYIPAAAKPEPIVPRERIYEVSERVDCFGDIIVRLDERAVELAVDDLTDRGVTTIAVGFLWSFLNPSHEQRVAEIIAERAPSAYVSLSHEIAPQLGEYYRIVATVMNSYIGPLMAAYVGDIDSGAQARTFRHGALFAQAIGGLVPAPAVRRKPLFTLDSGPVSGIVASNYLGTELGYADIITADMGGTTFDVSVIASNAPRRRDGTTINKYHMYLPMVDVESIGAGGGSIAWLDPASGTMKVGPASAGAIPGPICYGRGGEEPTVTDADVVLGRIDPSYFLHGQQRLDRAKAVEGVGALGTKLGLSPEATAAGIVQIIDNMMADKIRRMTVFRGHDPRDFVVFAFGGAGPMHASAFARTLGVRSVVVPVGNLASVLSAMGTISGDVLHVHDRAARLTAPFDMPELQRELDGLREAGAGQLRAEGFSNGAMVFEATVAMKYGAQVFDIEIPVREGMTSAELEETFESIYAQRYGKDSGYAPAGIAIIRERVYAKGELPRPRLVPRQAINGRAPQAAPLATTRDVWWQEHRAYVPTPIYRSLEPSHPPIAGPAIVELPDTTVVVHPTDVVRADTYGNLIIDFREE